MWSVASIFGAARIMRKTVYFQTFCPGPKIFERVHPNLEKNSDTKAHAVTSAVCVATGITSTHLVN